MSALNTGNRERLKFETKEVSYEWAIDDFMINRPFMQEMVDSQTFPRKGHQQWCIKLYPRGIIQPYNLSVYLIRKRAEWGEKPIMVVCNLQFLDDNGVKIQEVQLSGLKFGNAWMPIKQNNSNRPIPLSASGKLIIHMTIFIRKPVQKVSSYSVIEIPESSALGDLSKLLKSGDYADFIVESADGKVFPVHKNVLSTRNPLFFGLMFTSATKEARESRVELPFEGKIVASLLEYLYSDEVVNLTPIATQLYAVAHQYQMDRLVVICAANISRNLTVANISVAMGIAEVYEDAKLLSACQKFDSKPSGWDRIRKWFKGAQ